MMSDINWGARERMADAQVSFGSVTSDQGVRPLFNPTSFGFPLWRATVENIRIRLQVGKLSVREREHSLDAITLVYDDLERSWRAMERQLADGVTADPRDLEEVSRARDQLLDQIGRLHIALAHTGE